MTLTYHGSALLTSGKLEDIARSVNEGYAYWLEVEPGAPTFPWLAQIVKRAHEVMADPPAPCTSHWVNTADGPSSGLFYGFMDEHDRDVALQAMGTKVRRINPFSKGGGLYSADDIVNAIVGSSSMRLGVLGALNTYSAHRNGSHRLSDWECAEVVERLRGYFRGGLEAARGAVRPEVV